MMFVEWRQKKNLLIVVDKKKKTLFKMFRSFLENLKFNNTQKM